MRNILPGAVERDLRSMRQNTTHYLKGEGRHPANMHGIYRGVVEYNRDPEQRGRVMVRVLEDGPEMQIDDPEKPRVATGDLGWAEPCFIHPSGAQFGAFSVPPVGSRVFVLYGRSDRMNPIYFGGWAANSAKKRRYGATKTTLQPPLDREGKERYPARPAPYWDHWEEEQGNESPMETSEMVDDQPDVHMMFKTLKGASLMIKERDHAEEMVLTDRQGAELSFESWTDDLNRRGRRSATRLEAIKRDNLDFLHRMRLFDATRQGLEVETVEDDEAVTLQTHPPSEVDRTNELMPTRLAVEMDKGQHRLRVLYIEDHVVVGQIVIDSLARQMTIDGVDLLRVKANSDIWLESPTVRIQGDLEVQGEITQSGNRQLTFIDNSTDSFDSNVRNFQDDDGPDARFRVDGNFETRQGYERSTGGRR